MSDQYGGEPLARVRPRKTYATRGLSRWSRSDYHCVSGRTRGILLTRGWLSLNVPLNRGRSPTKHSTYCWTLNYGVFYYLLYALNQCFTVPWHDPQNILLHHVIKVLLYVSYLTVSWIIVLSQCTSEHELPRSANGVSGLPVNSCTTVGLLRQDTYRNRSDLSHNVHFNSLRETNVIRSYAARLSVKTAVNSERSRDLLYRRRTNYRYIERNNFHALSVTQVVLISKRVSYVAGKYISTSTRGWKLQRYVII